MQIGELVTRLSKEFIDSAPQVPWKLIRGARNIHAHDYDRVRPETVWESLIGDFPTLKQQIQSLLDKADDN